MRYFFLFTTAFAGGDKCSMGIATPTQIPALLQEVIRQPIFDQERCINPFGRDKYQAGEDPLGKASFAGVRGDPRGGGLINSRATRTWAMRKI